jgi:hypothetical protein
MTGSIHSLYSYWRGVLPQVEELVMDLKQLLRIKSPQILACAADALARARLKGYERAGPETTHLRLRALYNRLARCVEARSASGLVRYTEDIARSRFYHGVELTEVQTAFNALEEAIWWEMRAAMTPVEFMRAVGLLSTILGLSKDALARAYVRLLETAPCS